MTRIIALILATMSGCANAHACLTPQPLGGDRPIQRLIQMEPPELRPYHGRIGEWGREK
jgi:hypothetical protein